MKGKYFLFFALIVTLTSFLFNGCSRIVDCSLCEGKGELTCSKCDGDLTFIKEVDCKYCQGGKASCFNCDGEGRKECGICHASSMSLSPCFKCGGSGIDVTSYRGLPCNVCGGAAMTMQPCFACQEGYIECTYCYGEGSNTCAKCKGVGYSEIMEDCIYCNHSGKVTCYKCNGEGEYEEE